MAAWSSEIANEFIRLASDKGKALTQMQLQKLVYIANGWNLAINGTPLTYDAPEAWEYGPVYRELRNALRAYGSGSVTSAIKNRDFMPGQFSEDLDADATRELSVAERSVVERVYRDYGKYHAFQLSALTHQPGTPWSQVYGDGEGKSREIPANLIRDHFVHLAASATA